MLAFEYKIKEEKSRERGDSSEELHCHALTELPAESSCVSSTTLTAKGRRSSWLVGWTGEDEVRQGSKAEATKFLVDETTLNSTLSRGIAVPREGHTNYVPMYTQLPR